jgi:uncharacterized protein (DUF2461 family)
MSSSNRSPDQSSHDDDDRRRANARLLLVSQFSFYRRLVSKKHGFTVWMDLEPSEMTDSELEQAVGFLKDAAHLPPG